MFLGPEGRDFSSAARRASFSAFLRAASAFLASASSLMRWSVVSRCVFRQMDCYVRTSLRLISSLWTILRLQRLLFSRCLLPLWRQLLRLSEAFDQRCGTGDECGRACLGVSGGLLGVLSRLFLRHGGLMESQNPRRWCFQW